MPVSRPIASAKRLSIALAIAVLSLVAMPAIGSAQGPPPGELIGLEVKSVDAAARTVTGVQHCVSPERAGQIATFALAPNIDINAYNPGQIIGAIIDGGVIVGSDGPPCNVQPPPPGGNQKPTPPGNKGPQQGGPNQGGPNQGGPNQGGPNNGQNNGPNGGDKGGDKGEDLDKGFLSRVWKFVGEVDGYDDGKLSITVGKILNLPKKFADEKDAVVDEDALVLVSNARIYDKNNKKAKKADLEDAENVRVQGKMLPEAKWQKDEDGTPVTTIRAKKIYILG